MTAGIYRLEVPEMTRRERERIRQMCVEEGLLDEGELLDFEDWRLFTARRP